MNFAIYPAGIINSYRGVFQDLGTDPVPSLGIGMAAERVGMAERMGFEPMIRVSPYNDLANRRLQPLGHLSVRRNPYIL